MRITGSGFVKTGAVADGHPVEFRHWQEVVDECDRELESAAGSEEEEAVVELWLEYPSSFMDTDIPQVGSVRRLKTGGSDLRRSGDPFPKIAHARSWDEELAEAQDHAASVLSGLGKTS
jgi:hypothetical protein